MTKTYLFKPLLLGLLLLALVYVLWPQKHQNEIFVNVQEPLDPNLVEIQYGWYSISSKNDSLLVKDGLKDLVYQHGLARPVTTVNGENDFYVIYDQKYYTILRHYIPHDFHTGVAKPSTFYFKLKQQDSVLVLDLRVTGANKDYFKALELKEISRAKQYVRAVRP